MQALEGWKAAVPEVIYTPPGWGNYAAGLLVLLGFVLFLAPYPPNNLKRLLRHPQLILIRCLLLKVHLRFRLKLDLLIGQKHSCRKLQKLMINLFQWQIRSVKL